MTIVKDRVTFRSIPYRNFGQLLVIFIFAFSSIFQIEFGNNHNDNELFVINKSSFPNNY